MVVPYIKQEDYDYLVYTGLQVAPENPEIPNYHAQLPTQYSIFHEKYTGVSPIDPRALQYLVKPLTKVFKLVKLKDIVITFAKIDYAYMIALITVNRAHELLKIVFR